MDIKNILKNLKVLFEVTFKDYKFNKRHLFFRQNTNYEIEFSQLRIYCHMLDKGLNNPHFEKGHSKIIYDNAFELFQKLKNVYDKDNAFIWAKDILERYEVAQREGKPMLENQKEYLYSSEEMKILKVFIKSRTSCRNFKKNKISPNILKNIVEIAIDAPTGCCRQSSRFYITQDEKKINALIKNISGITNFTNVQCLVAVCAESSFYGIVDKNLQYVDASLSAENFILGARIYGIYGTMCNFFHATNAQVKESKEILGINDSENIVLFLVIGYPTLIPGKPVRQNIETFYKIR